MPVGMISATLPKPQARMGRMDGLDCVDTVDYMDRVDRVDRVDTVDSVDRVDRVDRAFRPPRPPRPLRPRRAIYPQEHQVGAGAFGGSLGETVTGLLPHGGSPGGACRQGT